MNTSSKAQILVPDLIGIHNTLDETARLQRRRTYKDQSTIIICPTRGMIHCRVVQAWLQLIKPMNQKVIGPIFMRGMEVGHAYEQALDLILSNDDLKTYKYLCTIEDDNIPPVDGLLKLYESIEGGIDGVKYDSVCGLYWTKGEEGYPMIYGDPKEPINFRPQIPRPETIQECHGTGMGFALMRLSLFTEGKIERPFYSTVQEPGRAFSQDLYFHEKARKAGYRIASDTRVKVGHYDSNSDIVW